VIYDASRDAISNSRDDPYAGNLRLVDRTLGDVRKALEKAGMWDTSTILLTSDHPVRTLAPFATPGQNPALRGLKQHNQVPYLLKMAGEMQGLVYDSAINTVVTKDLLLAVLD